MDPDEVKSDDDEPVGSPPAADEAPVMENDDVKSDDEDGSAAPPFDPDPAVLEAPGRAKVKLNQRT